MATVKFTPEGIRSAQWRFYKYTIKPKDKTIKSKRIKCVYSPIPDASLLGLNVNIDELATRVPMNSMEEVFEVMQVKKKVSPAEIADFYNAIAKSLKANISLVKALEKCAGMAKSPYFRGVLGTICYFISKEGGKFSTALSLFPDAFDESTIAMIEAGENAGETKEVFARLGQAATENVRMGRKIKGALIYPAVLTVAISGVVALVQFFVVPKMMPMFESMSHGQLPLSTRIVMGSGNFFKHYPWVVALPCVVALFVKSKWKQISENHNFQRITLKVPILGEVVRSYSIIRSFRTLSILLRAVVPLGRAFEIASRVSGNIVVAEYYGKICKRCVAGQSMAVAFSAERHALGDLGTDIAEQISIGESTGNTPLVIQEIITNLQDEMAVKLEALPNLANFVMLSCFAPVVILIALSVVEPSLKMAQDTLSTQSQNKQ